MNPPVDGDDLAGIYDGTPCALLSARTDGTIVAANQTLLSWTGLDRDEVVGAAKVAELLSVGGRIFWETHLAPVLQAEGQLNEVAVELRGPQERLPVLLSARVHVGDRGRPDLVRIVMASSAERRRFEQELIRARVTAERSETRLRVLQRVTAALSEAAGVDAVTAALLDAAVTQLGATAGTVWTLDPEQGPVEHSSVRQPGADVGLPVPADGGAVIGLRGQSGTHGLLALVLPPADAVVPVDPTMVTALAQQGGLALERARLFETNARVAHTLQRSLLAFDVPDDHRFSAAPAYRAGVEGLDVGGDWYDVFLTGPDRVAVVVGDVVGRGLGAASAMGQLRSAVRALSGAGTGPARLVGSLDRFVEMVTAASMATLAYAELDLASGRLTYACAGHPPPILLPADGEPRLLWGGRSTPLGIPLDRSEAHEQLRPGDRLLLYTDGLVERRERLIDEGFDLLRETAGKLRAQPPDALVRAVMDTLLRDERQPDDVCVLLVTWNG